MLVPKWTPEPFFVPGASQSGSRQYALQLARKVEQAWHALGHYSVKTRVEAVSIKHRDFHVREHIVRSNLVNGLPPGHAIPTT